MTRVVRRQRQNHLAAMPTVSGFLRNDGANLHGCPQVSRLAGGMVSLPERWSVALWGYLENSSRNGRSSHWLKTHRRIVFIMLTVDRFVKTDVPYLIFCLCSSKKVESQHTICMPDQGANSLKTWLDQDARHRSSDAPHRFLIAL